jgi:hypothetical protein
MKCMRETRRVAKKPTYSELTKESALISVWSNVIDVWRFDIPLGVKIVVFRNEKPCHKEVPVRYYEWLCGESWDESEKTME